MNYCGIDIGGLSSYVYVSDAAGRKKWNGELKTSRAMLEAVLKRYVRSGLKVAIEEGSGGGGGGATSFGDLIEAAGGGGGSGGGITPAARCLAWIRLLRITRATTRTVAASKTIPMTVSPGSGFFPAAITT